MCKVNAPGWHAMLLAGCALLFALGTDAVLAQGPAQGAAAGAAGPPPGFGPPHMPRQGFENNAQVPANYNREEKAAAAVVEKWIATIKHDTDGHMALIDDDILVRPDPLADLMHGPIKYCSTFLPALGSHIGTYTLDELYVVGGSAETDVLLKRTDINSPATPAGFLGGYPVPVSTFLRIRNGKVIEWEDMPTNKVSGGALSFGPAILDGPSQPPAWCVKYTPGRSSSKSARRAAAAHALNYDYGTNKPEFFANPFETAAAQTVRAWFAAWQSGDPLLLGAFVDPKVIFRSDPSQPLGHGRDNLLRQVCSSVGGQRRLIDLFVVGGDYDSAVLTRWDETSAQGAVRHRGSMFRVQNGLISEWMYDTSLDGSPASSGADSTAGNSVACQAVNAALGPPAGG